jgi:hypothetical protein
MSLHSPLQDGARMLGRGDENEIEKSHFLAYTFEIDGLKKSSNNVNRTAVKDLMEKLNRDLFVTWHGWVKRA